jgi:hypothetical protein
MTPTREELDIIYNKTFNKTVMTRGRIIDFTLTLITEAERKARDLLDKEYLERLAYEMDFSRKKGSIEIADTYFHAIKMIMTKRESSLLKTQPQEAQK